MNPTLTFTLQLPIITEEHEDFGFVFLLCYSSMLSAKVVSKEELFLSPNKIFQAHIDYHSDKGANQVYLKIDNLQTHFTQECGPILTPIHSVLCSPDSKTIVIIQHMANGCVPGVAHLSNGNWQFLTIYLPINGPARYSVSKLRFVPEGLKLTYRIAETQLNGTIIGYLVTRLDFDVSDFSVSKTRTRNIDQDEFESLGPLSD